MKVVIPKPFGNHFGILREAKLRDRKLRLKIDLPQLTTDHNMWIEFYDIDIEIILEALKPMILDTKE